MIREAPNINHLWTALLVEEFVRGGVNHFFIAPGSRSTPLVTAIARHTQATTTVHFDERGLAFAALGYAKATGKPAVWVTTSGTAVANGLPAVIEAFMDGIPLILLTADRPHELRQTGANQTIDQYRLFGSYLKWTFEGAAPTTEISPAYVLTSVDQAIHRSSNGAKGPVHMNWMFREPLAPVSTGDDFEEYLSELSDWIDNSTAYTTYASSDRLGVSVGVEEILSLIHTSKRGIIVAGRLEGVEEALAVSRAVNHLKWPVYADIASNLYLGSMHFLEATPLSSLLFKSISNKANSSVDTVLQFGKRTTSKSLTNWIRESEVKQYILVDPHSDRIDPFHAVSRRVEGSIANFCDVLADSAHPKKNLDNEWVSTWTRNNQQANERLSSYLGKQAELSEPIIARMISECIEHEHGLVLGNSMPVRDMNVFGLCTSNWVRTVTNRGASGIDGLIGTAAGFALGYGKPVTLILGDLSFLHDLNSLALANQVDGPLVIIVVNNDGGGIFSFLPIAEYDDVFESYFGTPHGLTFKAAAHLFGYTYHNPASCSAFRDVYSDAIRSNAKTLIEVQTERIQNQKIHQDVEAYLAA